MPLTFSVDGHIKKAVHIMGRIDDPATSDDPIVFFHF